MSPFIHFLLSIVAAMAMSPKYERKALMILALGILGVLPDLDHLVSYTTVDGMPVSIFHNLYLLTFLPLCLMFISFVVENARGGRSSAFQRFFLAAMVILTGHLVLDIIAGNVMMLHFPADTSIFVLENNVLIQSGIYGNLMDASDMILGGWLLAVVFTNIGQRHLYNISEGGWREDALYRGDVSQYLISRN